jgi:hypothetical protein
VRKTVTFATAFALAFGPAVSYAQLTCNGNAVIGSSSNNSNQATSAIASQMTRIMVCDPHSPGPPAWDSQEWHSGGSSGGTINEFSDPARVPYGTYTVTANGRKQDNNLRGTITYSYTGGSAAGPYMISVNGNNMYFCADGSSNAVLYSTTWKAAASVTSCP